MAGFTCSNSTPTTRLEYDWDGTPYDEDGAPYDEDGAPYDDDGAPYDDDGAPYDEDGYPPDDPEFWDSSLSTICLICSSSCESTYCPSYVDGPEATGT